MISKREVSAVRATMMVSADESDPLNQQVVLGFVAMVDGKEVYARSL